MKKFSRILQYVSQPKYRAKLFFYLLFTILSVLFGLISLGMLSPFMELLFKGAQKAASQPAINSNAVGGIKNYINTIISEHGKTVGLIVICIFIIVTTLLKNLFLYLSYYISSPIRTATITQLRSELYEKILSLPIGYFTERRKGDLISRMTNDIYEIESSVVATLEGLIKNPLTILGYLFYMIYLSPRLSLFLIILLPITAFFIGRISNRIAGPPD